jgi:hypothetical protein
MKNEASASEIAEVRTAVARLFEAARKQPGAPYEPERFLAYLTLPPVKTGRKVADTFPGRRRFVNFMHAVELEFAICFALDEWERGLGLDEFAHMVAARRHKSGALRMAQQRLQAAKNDLVSSPTLFGLLTSPLLVGAVKIDHPARFLLAVPWIVITGGITAMTVAEYRHARRLIDRIASHRSAKEGKVL